MPTYILPPRQTLSRDPALFPLLTDGTREEHLEHATRYPLTIALTEGERALLLVGGAATRQELERIAAGCAAAMLSRHAQPPCRKEAPARGVAGGGLLFL